MEALRAFNKEKALAVEFNKEKLLIGSFFSSNIVFCKTKKPLLIPHCDRQMRCVHANVSTEHIRLVNLSVLQFCKIS